MLRKIILMGLVGVLTLSVLSRAFVIVSSSLVHGSGYKLTSRLNMRMMATVGATEIKVIKAGDISEKDIKTMSSWPVWGCELVNSPGPTVRRRRL